MSNGNPIASAMPLGRRIGRAIGGPLLIDAHVHFHPDFSRTAFFDTALANFQRAAAELGLAAGWLGCLLFTESAGDNFFEVLRATEGKDGQRWAVGKTDETCSLIASFAGEPRIVVVAGRQIVTAEDIEVLALGTSLHFEDGADLPATLGAVLDAGAVAALPWGFGKWWFRRGRLIRQTIEDAGQRRIFLGDNGGRLALSPRPPLFDLAARRGIFILPGSDPLPMPSQVTKVGGYGFVLPGQLDASTPVESLKHLLVGLAAQPRTFGQLEAPFAFCRNQVMMQLRKRRRMRRR